MASSTFKQHQLTQKLKIGIDFGTTYSSVAFACTQKSHDLKPKVIPVGGFRLSQLNKVKFRLEYQVKTEIAWNPTLQTYVWGAEVEDSIRRKEIFEKDRITLLKLGLDDRKETAAIRARLTWQRKALPKVWDDDEGEWVPPSVEFLIAEFLKGMFAEARTYIKAKYRTLRQEDVFKASEVESVICIPALWKAEMIDSMIKAALKAGVPNPYPVSEPDAAAAFMVVKKHENHEAEGESDETQEPFLVVDAGGGTTDAITYIVRSRSPLDMDEGAEGDGEICGSVTLNERFRPEFASYIRNDLTRILEDMGKTNGKASETEFLNAAVASFELEGKRSFDGDPSFATVIYIPGLKRIAGRQVFDGYLKIPCELIKRVFEPVISTILLLIQRQCNDFHDIHRYEDSNQIKSVIFVGGLSGSPHVVSELNRSLNGDEPLMSYPVNLTAPEDSALLVAKGGILRAINKDSIQKRYLRRSFGCCWSEQYDDEVHKPGSWELGIFDGIPRVPDVIRWLYKKGDKIRQNCTQSVRGYRCVYVDGTETLDEHIFVSDITRQNSLSVHDPGNGIRHYGTLSLDLADIDTSSFPRQRSRKTKQSFFEVEYEVRMTIKHLVLTFEIVIPEKGKFPIMRPALGPNPTIEQIRASWGRNPIRKTLDLNCGAAFQAGYA